MFEIYAGTIDGRRRRYYRSTEKAAKKKIEEIEADAIRNGKLWVHLEDAGRSQALATLAEIHAAGLTLSQVWSHYQRSMDTSALNVVTLKVAQAALIEARKAENKRPAYIEILDFCTARFVARFPDWNCHQITLDLIKGYLAEFQNVSTRAGEHTRLASFFAFCKMQHYRNDNPFDRLKTPKVDYSRPKVLTLDDCTALLTACEDHQPELAPGLALKLFAGVRPDEVKKLRWADIRLDDAELVVDAAAAKTRDIRHVKLSWNCVSWLRKYAKQSGMVQPSRNWRRRFEAVKAAAKVKWSKDVLRHTALSYAYAKHGAQWASNNAGNSEKILFKHYRALVSTEDVEKFFSLMPRK